MTEPLTEEQLLNISRNVVMVSAIPSAWRDVFLRLITELKVVRAETERVKDIVSDHCGDCLGQGEYDGDSDENQCPDCVLSIAGGLGMTEPFDLNAVRENLSAIQIEVEEGRNRNLQSWTLRKAGAYDMIIPDLEAALKKIEWYEREYGECIFSKIHPTDYCQTHQTWHDYDIEKYL